MTQLQADTITVLEHELNVLRGLRISSNTGVAEVAVKRERLLAQELKELRDEARQQAELFNAIEDEELPAAVNFAKQPTTEGAK